MLTREHLEWIAALTGADLMEYLNNLSLLDRHQFSEYMDSRRQNHATSGNHSAQMSQPHFHQQQFQSQQFPANQPFYGPQQVSQYIPSIPSPHPDPLRRPTNHREWRPSEVIPGAVQMLRLDNSQYGSWFQARPSAQRRFSPGACAALTAQFLSRTFGGRRVAVDLGERNAIDLIQTAYESENLVEHEAEELLITQSGLSWTGYSASRNDDPSDPQWSEVLTGISSTVGGFFIYLANDDGDGHIIGFINDGARVYYIDPNYGIFDLGPGQGLAARVGQYMAIQHDQDEIRVYAVGLEPAPIADVRMTAQSVSAGLAHRRKSSTQSAHSRRRSTSVQSGRSSQYNLTSAQHSSSVQQRPVATLGSPREALNRDWNSGDLFRFWDNESGIWRNFMVRGIVRVGDRPRWGHEFFERFQGG